MVLLPPGPQGREVTEAYHVEDGAVAFLLNTFCLSDTLHLRKESILKTLSGTEKILIIGGLFV